MKRSICGEDLVKFVEQLAPTSFALEDDRVGLQVGNLQKPVRRVLITLDVLEPVVEEAIAKKIDFIIAHHPLLFKPPKKIDTSTSYGRVLEKCLRHEITVYAAHTNLDIAPGGLNDWLAEKLDLQNIDVLVPLKEIPLKKLVVFIPQEDVEQVFQALGNSGAGHIGNYSHCTFQSPGTGTFLPQEGTNPYIGETGKIERVKEIKLETIFPEHIQRKVIQTVINAHPYEEPAYDIYPLENKGISVGLGRIGELKKAVTFEQFAEKVKEVFHLSGLRLVGARHEKVQKVAVLGGDGNKYISTAQKSGADVFITGDLYYHHAHDAWMEGFKLIDPGHHIEQVMKKGMHDWLVKMLEQQGERDVEVFISEEQTDPFQFL